MRKEEIEKLKFDGWILPDTILAEIGRMTVIWSSLESFLLICIGKLAGYEHTDPKIYMLFLHSTFPQKLDVLARLCEMLKQQFPNLAGYEDVISKLKSAQKTRNKYAHSAMYLDQETGEIVILQASSRGKLKTSIGTFDITDIKMGIIEIYEAQAALYKIIMGKDLPPVPKHIQINT